MARVTKGAVRAGPLNDTTLMSASRRERENLSSLGGITIGTIAAHHIADESPKRKLDCPFPSSATVVTKNHLVGEFVDGGLFFCTTRSTIQSLSRQRLRKLPPFHLPAACVARDAVSSAPSDLKGRCGAADAHVGRLGVLLLPATANVR